MSLPVGYSTNFQTLPAGQIRASGRQISRLCYLHECRLLTRLSSSHWGIVSCRHVWVDCRRLRCLATRLCPIPIVGTSLDYGGTEFQLPRKERIVWRLGAGCIPTRLICMHLSLLLYFRVQDEVTMAAAERQRGVHPSTTPLICKQSRKMPLVDKRGGLNVERRGLPQTGLYWGDLFHTLVNLPNIRFFGLLFITYFLLFVVFAIPYYYEAHNNFCIPGVRTFSHAIWFSVQTSMTIGYGGELTPDPRCLVTNSMVMVQSIASLIAAYSLLGIFYARFSRPTRRAQTLIFSRCMVLSEEDGVPVLALRMANIRKHQVIEASVRMLVALHNSLASEDDSVFNFINLPLIGGSQIFLGLPCLVKHPITASSPLYGLTLQAMEDGDMEVLVLLEGVDASTSCKLQARHSYLPADICTESRFETMVGRLPSGRRCVDFSKFDSVVRTTENLIIRPGLTPLTPSSRTLPTFMNFPPEEPKNSSLEDDSTPEQTASAEDSDDPRNADDECSESSTVPPLKAPNRLQRSLSGGANRRGQSEYDPRQMAKAEAKVQMWKQMLMELALRIQHTAHHQPDQGSHLFGPLLESAKQALVMTLASDPT